LTIDFEALFALSPNPYVVLDADHIIVWMNEAYLRTTMREREAITGKQMFEAFPSEPGTESYDLLKASLDRVAATGQADEIALIRYDILTPDGVMDQRYWSATHTPLRNGAGKVTHVLQHTVDVTELQTLRRLREESGLVKRASAIQARNQDLLAESGRLRNLFEQAPGFMAVLVGPDYVFQMANEAYRWLVSRREILGKPLREAVPEIESQGYVKVLDEVRATGVPYVGRGVAVMLANSSGVLEERFLDFIYQPIHADNGEISAVFMQGHDVTEEVMLAQRQEMLINELNHRVKNMLAIVQGLAAQSFRGLAGSAPARDTFDARLKALAAAHDLLTEQNWQPTSLAETVRSAIAATAGGEVERVSIEGEDVLLQPQTAVALAMTLHELSTNAIKYGALSAAGGCITVRWRIDDTADEETLNIVWLESGGPPVVPPLRKGFGTRLIERGLAGDAGAQTSIEFAPAGVRCRITLNLPRERA
jgi:PAS domain S-box-containing protein